MGFHDCVRLSAKFIVTYTAIKSHDSCSHKILARFESQYCFFYKENLSRIISQHQFHMHSIPIASGYLTSRSRKSMVTRHHFSVANNARLYSAFPTLFSTRLPLLVIAFIFWGHPPIHGQSPVAQYNTDPGSCSPYSRVYPPLAEPCVVIISRDESSHAEFPCGVLQHGSVIYIG